MLPKDFIKRKDYYGTEGSDTLISDGSARASYFYGYGGNDSLVGAQYSALQPSKGFSNIFETGNGNDTIQGGFSDTIKTGNGNDLIYADITTGQVAGTSDVIDSGSGNDTLYTGGGDKVRTGEGNDVIYSGNNLIPVAPTKAVPTVGTQWVPDSVYNRRISSMEIDAGAGDDLIIGKGSGARLSGEAGNDTLSTTSLSSSLSGGEGNDSLTSNPFADPKTRNFLTGNEGNDTLIASNPNDVLNGGTGDDLLMVSSISNQIKNLDGNDKIVIPASMLSGGKSKGLFNANAKKKIVPIGNQFGVAKNVTQAAKMSQKVILVQGQAPQKVKVTKYFFGDPVTVWKTTKGTAPSIYLNVNGTAGGFGTGGGETKWNFPGGSTIDANDFALSV